MTDMPNQEKNTRNKLASARRIVIKIGTSTITYDNGRFNWTNMEQICRSVANQMNQGRQIILVSSGAIGAGVGRLRLKEKPLQMREKQAVAAVGQCELMSMYSRLLAEYNYSIAQILLTKDDIDDNATQSNICNTFEALLEKEIIPIVNENDTVSTREIYHNGTFGDNDMLSAIVAELLGADLLIILSDIEGLYTLDPRKNGDASLIETVDEISEKINSYAGKEGSNRGTGGMHSKLMAVQTAVRAGMDTVIANGSKARVIDRVLSGEQVGTWFKPGQDKILQEFQK